MFYMDIKGKNYLVQIDPKNGKLMKTIFWSANGDLYLPFGGYKHKLTSNKDIEMRHVSRKPMLFNWLSLNLTILLIFCKSYICLCKFLILLMKSLIMMFLVYQVLKYYCYIQFYNNIIKILAQYCDNQRNDL